MGANPLNKHIKWALAFKICIKHMHYMLCRKLSFQQSGRLQLMPITTERTQRLFLSFTLWKGCQNIHHTGCKQRWRREASANMFHISVSVHFPLHLVDGSRLWSFSCSSWCRMAQWWMEMKKDDGDNGNVIMEAGWTYILCIYTHTQPEKCTLNKSGCKCKHWQCVKIWSPCDSQVPF